MTGYKELFAFTPDEESTVPIWAQLSKRIAFLIEAGILKPGDKLPKIRELAVEISINFNTVNRAYLHLQSEGLLKSVRGQGVFVSEIAAPASEGSSLGEVEELLDDCLRACQALGVEYEETVKLMNIRAKRMLREVEFRKAPYDSRVILVDPSSKTYKEAR